MLIKAETHPLPWQFIRRIVIRVKRNLYKLLGLICNSTLLYFHFVVGFVIEWRTLPDSTKERILKCSFRCVNSAPDQLGPNVGAIL